MRDLLISCAKQNGWLLESYPYVYLGQVALEQIHPDLMILNFELILGGLGISSTHKNERYYSGYSFLDDAIYRQKYKLIYSPAISKLFTNQLGSSRS